MEAGRELDERVAKLMGWSWDESTACSPTGSQYARHAMGIPSLDPWWWMPEYSTNLEQAWRVVEKYKAYAFELERSPHRRSVDQWWCKFTVPDSHWEYYCSPYSATPALAICRVAVNMAMRDTL